MENVDVSAPSERPDAPPVRRGSRDERREATLRALAAGEGAGCAYCGQPLPPIPPQGGRPTPYCPVDPERYGRWGAKVISCAMLDEQREIWVSVYGPDQPMTTLDTRALDEHLASALTALAPLNAEITALRTHVLDQTAAALSARDHAETTRDQALAHAQAAEADRDAALAAAEHATTAAEEAQQRADADRVELHAALDTTTQALRDKDAALAAQKTAEADRQRALEQVSVTQDRVAALQAELASDRAASLDRLDQLRREAEQARQTLRATLTAEHDNRLRAQAEDFDERARHIRDTADQRADQRVADLAGQLAQATESYATALAPLHERIDTLRGELAAQTGAAAERHRRLVDLRAALRHALDTPEPAHLRDRLTAVLGPEDPQDDDRPRPE